MSEDVLGLGIGKVFGVGGLVANAFAEPQFTVNHTGDAQPARQLLAGSNFQFPKKWGRVKRRRCWALHVCREAV